MLGRTVRSGRRSRLSEHLRGAPLAGCRISSWIAQLPLIGWVDRLGWNWGAAIMSGTTALGLTAPGILPHTSRLPRRPRQSRSSPPAARPLRDRGSTGRPVARQRTGATPNTEKSSPQHLPNHRPRPGQRVVVANPDAPPPQRRVRNAPPSAPLPTPTPTAPSRHPNPSASTPTPRHPTPPPDQPPVVTVNAGRVALLGGSAVRAALRIPTSAAYTSPRR